MRGNMKRIIVTGILSLAAMVGISASVVALSRPHSPPQYVAMGDSIAAGAGLSARDTVCDRSSQAYPQVVGQTLGMQTRNLACSGAKADEGIYGEQERGSKTLPEQMDRAFARGTPDLISLTIGANDIRWVEFTGQCYYYHCGYEADTARSAVYLADFRLELNWIMARIHHESGGNPPTVLVTGYYNPLESYACVAGNRITPDEAAWLAGRTDELNEAIRETVARYSYAQYVPVDFSGHGLCSSSPWIQGLADDAPFHPTADGQWVIARDVLTKYNQAASKTTAQEADSWREEALDWFDSHW